jgi:hypothetical protein
MFLTVLAVGKVRTTGVIAWVLTLLRHGNTHRNAQGEFSSMPCDAVPLSSQPLRTTTQQCTATKDFQDNAYAESVSGHGYYSP